jgi:DNA-binding response OmpR family regulator
MRVRLPYTVVVEVNPVAAAGEEKEVPVLRILVIDDEPLIRKSVGDVLRRWGHEVFTASSGEEGVTFFRSAGERTEGVDVVITDLGMPKMDGMEVARQIKEVASQTPVIMLTGWGQQLSPTAERTPHVDILLSKPPQLTDLRAALETVSSSGKRKGDSPA